MLAARLRFRKLRVESMELNIVQAEQRKRELYVAKADRDSADREQGGLKRQKAESVRDSKVAKGAKAGGLVTDVAFNALAAASVPAMPQSATGKYNLTGKDKVAFGGALEKKTLCAELTARGLTYKQIQSGLNKGTPTEKVADLLQRLAEHEDPKWTAAAFAEALKERTPIYTEKKTDVNWTKTEWKKA